MGPLVRSLDWTSTGLGPIERWPSSLRTTVGTVLGSRFPMLLWWGPELIQIYNDAYRPILGDKHPRSLGARGPEVWTEIWHIIGPMAESIQRGEDATWSEHLLLPMKRKGFLEETYFTFSYSPVPDDRGERGGVLVTCQETTEQVLSDRRLRTLQRISPAVLGARNGRSAAELAVEKLAENVNDLPFAALYLVEGPEQRLVLARTTGLDRERGSARDTLELRADGEAWPIARVLASRQTIEVELPPAISEAVHRDTLPPPTRAVLMPIEAGTGEELAGVLAFGLSGRLTFDESYAGFLQLLVGQISAAFAQAEAYEQERKRAEALAQLDEAKTTFFSNVSHEFRTPITLMLGPVEDSLRDPSNELSAAQRERLEMIRRNGVRLLKLVNTLLDFSRIEAGRILATYRSTDLCAATVDLASSFRSLVESAGLRFEVECASPSLPAFVDREMWEKIVLNLLSNAFKFTFEGGIRVSLREREGFAELEVADTGTGIAGQELPHLFERFHRIEGARGRSYEGSGIGLALIRELVRLHGGNISVESELNRGSCFTVRIPLGSAHLPVERMGPPSPAYAAAERTTSAFLEEASQWSRDGRSEGPPSDPGRARGPVPAAPERTAAAGLPGRILLVEDNSDMRSYLRQLLEGAGWTVTPVGDGEDALRAVRGEIPDLVLTDVMMPRLDGFGLLRALRSEPRTRNVPVMMLSARAGEDARIDSLQYGADDFLLKPFSARELLARVRIHLELSRTRRAAELQRQSLNELFMEAPAMIAVLRGPEHVFELANPLYMRAVGMRDIVGKPIREALPELIGQPFLDMLDRTYQTGVVTSGSEEIAVLDRRGAGQYEEAFFNFSYRPTRNVDGQVDGILVFAFDVTELVHARQKAEALSEDLKVAGQRKDEFLAMLAHELRNPMAAIGMSLSLLERPGLEEPKARKHREMARRQMGTLVRLVDDLLDVSRITRGKVELRKEPVDLASVVQNAITATRPAIESQRHELSFTVASGTFRLDADGTRLEQVVTNLLTNAAKYTPEGGVISVRLARESADGAHWAVLRVKDTGRGIPAEMIDQVFDLFVQVNPSIDRQSGGLGLGLTLVKQLVEMHGGRVTVHSDGAGQGSEFVVRLPLSAPAAQETHAELEPEAEAPDAPARRRIVVIEDSADIREGLREFLEDLGHSVQVAANGLEGVERLLEVKPDVALVDVGLPGIDGYEVARRVRAAQGASAPYLIALTGYGGREDRERSSAAGFDLHMTKPIDIDALPNVVSRARRQG